MSLVYAGVAQWQRSRLVSGRLWVRVPPPAPEEVINLLRENETRELLSKIEKIQERYETQVANVIVEALHKSQSISISELAELWSETEKEIEDLLYEMLEAIYSLILSFIQRVYPEARNLKLKLNIKTLTWQEDGKTIEDRVKALCNFAYQALLDRVNVSLRENLIYTVMRIMETEIITVFNKTLRNRVSGAYPFAQVINTGSCEDVCEHWGGKFIPVEELTWPPYHPSCRCVVILFTADEINE